MLDTLSAVMGDYAPRKRRLLLDFKDDHGQDRNMDAIVWHNPKTTDETVVRMLKEQLCSDGGRLSAISEVLEDGTGYCLYRLMLKDYPDVMDIGQMCEALGVSTKTGYKLLKDGKIEYLKIGRAYRIPKAHILRYLKITCSTFAE